jgi:hemerythrin-like domain-containing protein
MNATELLRKDHASVKQLFAELESAGESPEDRSDALNELTEQLLVHSAIEEEIFYPAIRKSGSQGAEGKVEEAVKEHQQVKDMLNKLSLIDVEDREGFAESAKRLCQDVEHHVKEEEGEMFAIAKQLGAQQLDKLGEQLQQRKEELLEQGVIVEE